VSCFWGIDEETIRFDTRSAASRRWRYDDAMGIVNVSLHQKDRVAQAALS